MKRDIEKDVRVLRQSIKGFPEPAVAPAFVVVSGLPGTGKSFFCRKLAQEDAFCMLESDALRKTLFSSPDYSVEESSHLFMACHCLIEDLLNQGLPVIFDATNLSEYNREQLYRISDRVGAKLILVSVEAPTELVHERLQMRKSTPDPDDKSDANWAIYQKMRPVVDLIKRNHFVVDTSRDIHPVIKKIIREINR
jgi:predicted kinase